LLSQKETSNTEDKAVAAASTGARLIKIKAIITRDYGHNY
jgi:hypothetical protein